MNGQDAFKRFLAGQDREEDAKKEESLPNSDLDDYSKAIKNSEETAKSEAQNRNNFKSKFVQDLDNNNKTSSKTPDLDLAEESAKVFNFDDYDDATPSTSRAIKDTPETPKVVNLFEKFSKVQNASSLKPIYHKPVRPLPILTNPIYEGLTIEVKARVLSDYYAKLNRVQGKLARLSWIMAPRPAPIYPSEKGNGSLFKHSLKDDDEFTNNNEKAEVYVSRSGRQVKRKTYAEDSDNENDDAFAPSSFYGSSKKNKFSSDFGFDDSDNKITLDLPLSPVKRPSVETPKRSAFSLKKSQETVEKRNNWTGKKTRSEAMFDALKDESTKRKVEEDNMAKFEKTLEVQDDELSEEDPLIIPSSQGEEKDSTFIRRRVTPPPPSRGRGRGRGRAKRPQDDLDRDGPSSNTPNNNRKKKMPKLCLKTLDEVTLTAINKVSCPLCSKKFHQDEIENHAATCSLEEEDAENEVALAVMQESPPSRRPSDIYANSTLRCKMCCKDINVLDYHGHTTVCIASLVEHI